MANEQVDSTEQVSSPTDSVASALSAMLDQINAWREEAQSGQLGKAESGSSKLPLPSIEMSSDRSEAKVPADDVPNPFRQLASGDKLPEGEPPAEGDHLPQGEKLTEAESTIFSQLDQSVQRADTTGIKRSLADALQQGPESFDRIMRAARDSVYEDSRIDVTWERGTNHRGEAFARMNFSVIGSKSGPFTRLTVSTNGRDRASHTPYMEYDKPAEEISGRSALRLMMSPAAYPPAPRTLEKPQPVEKPNPPQIEDEAARRRLKRS